MFKLNYNTEKGALPQDGIYLVSFNVPPSCKAPLTIYLNKFQSIESYNKK